MQSSYVLFIDSWGSIFLKNPNWYISKMKEKPFVFKYYIIAMITWLCFFMVPYAIWILLIGMPWLIFVILFQLAIIIFTAIGFTIFCFSLSLLLIQYTLYILKWYPLSGIVIVFILMITISIMVWFIQWSEVSSFLISLNIMDDNYISTEWSTIYIIKNFIICSIMLFPITTFFYIVYSHLFKK